ncbi:MAG: prephenate dehydratase [Pelosinus sp.]|nr:prephenate dehydratase [Pelosinus sp.]
MSKIQALSVGFLGPKGTYSEEMALSIYAKEEAALVPYTSISAVIRAVETGEVSQGVVPIENSIEGSINITLDMLAHDVHLFITQEKIKSIHNYLLVNGETWQTSPAGENIELIISHEQPLAQCRNYINTHFPKARIKVVESTSTAASLVAAGKVGWAAICSQRAAEIYNLKIAAGNIQDNDSNRTRFVVIKKRPDALVHDGLYKTLLACRINGERPGALYELLTEFVKRNINITKIESRPARTNLGEYIFFLDIDGGIHSETIRELAAAVEEKTLWFKNLGSYLCEKNSRA